jgi:5-methylcytosine-specific restriction endonuclease McrA
VLTKLCLCGEDAEPGRSRCADCRLPRTPRPSTAHPALRTARWTRLSRSLRKASPFCELCGSTEQLQVDHIIPASEDETLIFDRCNLRVICGWHNRSRSNNCTDDERAAVHAAIARRRQRRTAI